MSICERISKYCQQHECNAECAFFDDGDCGFMACDPAGWNVAEFDEAMRTAEIVESAPSASTNSAMVEIAAQIDIWIDAVKRDDFYNTELIDFFESCARRLRQ